MLVNPELPDPSHTPLFLHEAEMLRAHLPIPFPPPLLQAHLLSLRGFLSPLQLHSALSFWLGFSSSGLCALCLLEEVRQIQSIRGTPHQGEPSC